MKVILKKEKRSAKFGLIFPKGIELTYNPEMGCVEHPKNENIWIKVKKNEFKLAPVPSPQTKELSDYDKAYISTHLANGDNKDTVLKRIYVLDTAEYSDTHLQEINEYIDFCIANDERNKFILGFYD